MPARLTLGQWYGERFLTQDEVRASSMTVESTIVWFEQWGDYLTLSTCICGHGEEQHIHGEGRCTYHDARWAHSSKFLRQMHTCKCRGFTVTPVACGATWDT